MLSKRRCSVALTMPVLAVALAAPSAASAQITREQYVVQAETVCHDNYRQNRRVLRGVRRMIKKHKYRRAARRIFRAARLFKIAINQVDAIEKPVADVETLTRWMYRLGRQVVLLRKLARAVKAGKINRAQYLSIKLNRNGRRANNVVLGFGFDYCLIKPRRFA